MRAKVTLDNVDKALAGLADIIEQDPDGDKYWPLFERLERMRDKLVSRKRRLTAARQRYGATRADFRIESERL